MAVATGGTGKPAGAAGALGTGSTAPKIGAGSVPGMFCTPGAWPAANAGAATAAGTAVEPSAATAAGAGPSSGIVTGPWNGGGITPFAGGGGGGCAGGGGITETAGMANDWVSTDMMSRFSKLIGNSLAESARHSFAN